jgi:hypothetical protein
MNDQRPRDADDMTLLLHNLSTKPLSDADVAEAARNLIGFFQLLAEIDRNESEGGGDYASNGSGRHIRKNKNEPLATKGKPMGMTIREGARELATVVSWYTFMVEKLGATSEEARVLMENVISAIELNPPRAAKFPELFECLNAQWRHFGQKRKLLDEWLTKMARDSLYWPLRLPVRGSRVGDQILKALRTGRKTDVQIVRAFPKSAKMTLTKLSPTIGLAIKAGKIMRVGWGEYALPEWGLAAYISPNRLLVELVIDAPDYPPAEDALVAAMRERGHTDDGAYHSLKWLRENGVFSPRCDGRVRLSAESLAKRERGEELRDGRGSVLWAPPLVVPTEVATWEMHPAAAARLTPATPWLSVPIDRLSIWGSLPKRLCGSRD